MNTLCITSTVKKYPKQIPYQTIKDKILGKRYQVSLNFIGKKRATSINLASRNKDYAPNILSFPLTEKEGEIYICPVVTNREAQKFNLSPDGYIAYLFIHGLLHLKGHDHGDTMEKLERKYVTTFSIK